MHGVGGLPEEEDLYLKMSKKQWNLEFWFFSSELIEPLKYLIESKVFFFFNFLLGTMRIRKNRSDIRSYKFCWKNSVTIHNHQLLQIISIWNRFDRSRLPVRFGSENRKFSQTKMFRRVMAGTDFSDIRSFWLEISWFELWYEWNEIKTNNGQDGKRRLVFFSFREMRRDVKDVLKLFRNFSFSVLLNFLTQILNYYSTSSSIAHDFTV